MEPGRFEKDIQEKLRGRKIHPREEVWEKLASRLDSDQRPPRRIFWVWLGSAAACLVLIFGLSMLFPDSGPKTSNAAKVSAPSDAFIKSEGSFGANPITPQISGEAKMPSLKNPQGSGIAIPAAVVRAPEPIRSEKVDPVKMPLRSPQEIGYEPEQLSLLISGQMELVLAKVAMMEAAQDKVSEAEIDSLLRQAQTDIALQRPSKDSYSVSAGALLAQAEEELDQSFKEQLFNKLKDQFNKLRGTLADRNN